MSDVWGEGLFLDDLAVGMRFVTGSYALTREEMVAFAGQWDPQPFHLDDAAARESLFGGLAASGWYVMGVSMRLLVARRPFAGGLIGAGITLEWPRPTRAGEVLHVEGEVMEITPSRSKPDRAIVVVRQETKNAAGVVAQVAVAKLVSFRRPSASA